MRSMFTPYPLKNGSRTETSSPQSVMDSGPSCPGYHGKGLYSGQGVLVYANNGEKGDAARRAPFVPSGALRKWKGTGDWQLIRRNQFTEVTGPGGIYGNAGSGERSGLVDRLGCSFADPDVLDDGTWHRFRLPKASHCYDGAHGWNTEWPRIRDIGEDDLLMTMHGMFWRFPRTFSSRSSTELPPVPLT